MHKQTLQGLACQPGSCVSLKSTDRGTTWSAQAIPALPDGAGSAVLAVNPTDGRQAVAGVRPHSAGASREPMMVRVYGPDGSPEQSSQSPAADSLIWVGNSILGIGGAQRSVLASSVDGGTSWQTRQTPAGAAPTGELDGTATYGAPIRQDANTVVIPALRVGRDGAGALVLLRTHDGITFDSLATAPVTRPSAVGIAPVAAMRGSSIYVAIPGDPNARVWANGALAELAGAVPADIEELTFADNSHGLAVVSSGACETGKAGCTNTAQLQVTNDGGRTWQAAPAPTAS